MNPADRSFELGKLYCDRGEFDKAVPSLMEAAQSYFAERNFSGYLNSQNYLLRAHAEREEYNQINAIKEHLQDLVLKEGFELNAKTFYALGMCAFYKGQVESALEYLQKSLALALKNDNKEDICHAIFGLARAYATPQLNRYQDALKEIYNLEVFFQVYKLPELQVSTLMLNANILADMKKYDEAIEVVWKAYDVLRTTKNIVTGTYLMVALADIYNELGDKDLARVHIQLAQKSVDAKNTPRLAKIVKNFSDKMGGDSQSNFDLIFDETNHTVTERKLGRIDFGNQFILLDLLRLFVRNQGTVYSKEFLVENIWKQPYDPEVHDNKIYVTIKRLRKMIEPDYEKPKYIFRAKNGYYMNKSARVQLEH